MHKAKLFARRAFEHLNLALPLDLLLCSGGDDRLDLDSADRLNRYGCSQFPRPDVITFSSSTATSVSERGYRRAARAHDVYRAYMRQMGPETAFARMMEQTRQTLLSLLGLGGTGAEAILSASGTDCQLLAASLASLLLGKPAASIVVGCNESGSGATLAAGGKHFRSCTARGKSVAKGAAIDGVGPLEQIDIPFSRPDGRTYSVNDLDEAVLAAVSKTIGRGKKVILFAMETSKLGRRGPSDACLDEIQRHRSDAIQIIVDACQARLTPARIRRHLDRGFMVMLTGSKFFTGPPLSGALLVPQKSSRVLAAVANYPCGLNVYSNASEWPEPWQGARSFFPNGANLGLWLRWEAALEEIAAYDAIPASFRRGVMARFAAAIPDILGRSRAIELLPPNAEGDVDDGEFAHRTIFPFVIRKDRRCLTPEGCAAIYAALNRDVSRHLSACATPREREVAAQPCQLGQPVVLHGKNSDATAALRLNVGARMVSESWSDEREKVERNIAEYLRQAETVVQKIDLLLDCGLDAQQW